MEIINLSLTSKRSLRWKIRQYYRRDILAVLHMQAAFFMVECRDWKKEDGYMEERIALIGIIVEKPDAVEELNHLLHEYSAYIIGRMGVPYRKKDVNIISIAMDAPQDKISALSGKIGRLSGISAKTIYAAESKA